MFLRHEADREIAWSRERQNRIFQYCYLEAEYQRLFALENEWIDSDFYGERRIPQYLIPYMIENVLVGPHKFFDDITTSQLYYHPGVDTGKSLQIHTSIHGQMLEHKGAHAILTILWQLFCKLFQYFDALKSFLII